MTGPFSVEDGTGRKRNSCKAVVVSEGRVLLTVNRDHLGDFYLLPGGGQKFGETVIQAMVREVIEETGWLVEPGRLVLVRDYLGANHQFARWESDVHQTEIVFMAKPLEQVDSPPEHDAWQTGVEWVSPERIASLRIYPDALRSILPGLIRGDYGGPVYIGDVN
ncbi:MAG: hypothetical protein AVO35_07945 [Candidatus Aegiribacteria sp. MLS_C]|nr:MAG: hypothetical protein AVO35_07945 [Candidatus Aegiribacteria sp. MLS_C]